jgi:hypothetical protein
LQYYWGVKGKGAIATLGLQVDKGKNLYQYANERFPFRVCGTEDWVPSVFVY